MKNPEIEDVEFFRLAFDCTTDSLFIIDRGSMKFVDANPAACRITGYNREELLRIGPHDLKPLYTKELLSAKFDEILRGDEKKSVLETSCIRKDKNSFQAEWRLGPFAYKGNHWLVASVKDIGDRKRLPGPYPGYRAEHLNPSLLKPAEITNIFEKVTDAFVVFDKEWCCYYTNHASAGLFNRDPESIIGENIWKVFPQSIGGSFYKACYQSMETQNYVYLEDYYAPLDRWIETHMYPSTEGLSIFFRDSSERRETQEKLNKSNERFEMMGLATTDAVWSWDLVTGEGRHNNTFLQLFDDTASGGEIVYPTLELWKSKIHAHDRKRVLSSINQVTVGAAYSNWQETYRFLKPDGSYGIFCDRGFVFRDEKENAVRMMGSMMDITERKQVENSLRESEARYRNLFEEGGDAIVVFSPKMHRFIEVNKKAIELSGYSKKELLNLQVEDVVLPGDLIDKPLNFPSMESTPTIKNESKWKKKDGTIIDVENIVKMMPDGNYLGFLRDITERKQAEIALQGSEARFRRIFDSNMVGMIFWDADRKIIEANGRFLGMFGYTIEDLTEGRVILENMEPGKFEHLGQECLDELKLTGICQPFEKEYLHKNGHVVSVLIGAASISVENPEMGVSYLMDITDRKKTEQELAESENRMRTILQTEPESVTLIGRGGHLLEINPAGLEMTEAESAEQVLGMPMLRFVQAEYREAFKKLTQDVFNDKPCELEFKITGLKGTERWLETHAVPFKNAAGSIISLLGLSRDITERKKSEEILRQSYADIRLLTSHLQDIREEERTSMAREIHDELGQQLTGIKMDVYWLNSESKLGKKEKDKIKGILELLDGTINTVRKISAKLRPSLLDDLGLVEALKLHSVEFQKRSGIHVQFTTNLQDIKIAPKAAIGLFRIFQESLTNVARHAEARNVSCCLTYINNKILLKIVDDGKGFDTTEIANKKTLGLLGMKERILMMEGKYEISSRPGNGTRIAITIPMESIIVKPANNTND